MKKKKLAGISSAALGIAIATGVTGAYAASDSTPFFGNEENRTALQESIQNDDYSTWSTLVQTHVDEIQERADEAESFITEDTFDTIQEAQDLAESGDVEAAKELMNSAGIPKMLAMPGGPGHNGKGMHKHGGNPEQMEAIKAALEAEDYEAWVAAVEAADGPLSENTSEERYNEMLQVHELMVAGDEEGAHELREQFREAHRADQQ